MGFGAVIAAPADRVNFHRLIERNGWAPIIFIVAGKLPMFK